MSVKEIDGHFHWNCTGCNDSKTLPKRLIKNLDVKTCLKCQTKTKLKIIPVVLAEKPVVFGVVRYMWKTEKVD
jgi:hypothetical protein